MLPSALGELFNILHKSISKRKEDYKTSGG
jgi:hypothetical protein